MFLECRVQSLEQTHSSSPQEVNSKSAHRETRSKGRAQRSIVVNVTNADRPSSKPGVSCAFCQQKHSVFLCSDFRSKPQPERFSWCKRENACLNCLGRNHRLANCPSHRRCSTCSGKHHTLLHSDRLDTAEPRPGTSRGSAQNLDEGEESKTKVAHATTTVLATPPSANRSVLLATANIIMSNEYDSSVGVRALIDPAAEISLVSDRVASLLSLKRTDTSTSIYGVGATRCARASGEVSFILKSKRDNSFALNVTALVVREVTRFLPSSTLPIRDWTHIRNLPLADHNFANSARVDAILGVEVYQEILRNGVVRGPPGSPLAQSTVFGWILSGSINSSASRNSVTAFHIWAEKSTSAIIQRFWEIEEIPPKRILSSDDKACEMLFSESTTRNAQGRFMVRLPFCKYTPLTDSKEIARACLTRSVRRRSTNPSLDEAYRAFMLEYQKLGHMKLTSQLERENAKCYLPHHAVFRRDNPSKIRVVFNASQKGRQGLSLNDLLHPGPKLQSDIAVVLTNWRFHAYVFTADIVKMFRQILVHPEDAQWQHILWQQSSDSPVIDLQAVTVTYGTACAPFLAIRTLLQLAQDGSSRYPHAADILRNQIYVDDIFSGAQSIEQAAIRRKEVVDLLQTAGMELGKWAANDIRLLEGTPPSGEDICVELDDPVSTLGILWRPSTDSFTFSTNLPPSSLVATKRTILSEIAKLFDPLGWLSPLIVVPKIIMQDIWLLQVDWDVPLTGDILTRWHEFRNSLSALPNLQIPRFTGVNENQPWTLHGFCDASKRAYAAVVYSLAGDGKTTLLMAKSKVAPLQVQSLPRLELCGALLLTRLTRYLIDNLRVKPLSVNLWSDSKVVLDWLKGHPSKWNVFVANRVSEIQTALPSASWRHVVSADNPADAASRGLCTEPLLSLSLWWQGPKWLSDYRNRPPAATEDTNAAEMELQVLAAMKNRNASAEAQAHKGNHVLETLSKHSNINKIINIVGLCLRWRLKTRSGPFTAAEWSAARRALFLLIQHEHFQGDLTQLRSKGSVAKSSSLLRLAPFISEAGLLRVGGRLQHSTLAFGEMHPVILPHHERLVRLLVEDAHRVTMHGGPQVMLSYLNRSTWIIGCSRLARSVYRKCVVCTRYSGHIERQQMAPLPPCRVTALRPFAYTGLDFAGPFPLRMSKGRGAKAYKGYLAIFICMAVRAVHLEVVSDLTTEAFLAAYARFVARRGVCVKVFSDNATTFKGAAAELAKLFNASSPELQKVIEKVALQGTSWEFIPPRAPHFGGLWEAAVKSFKYHYRRVIGDSKLTFEEMSTLAARIEACLNSRPISPLSSCGTDIVAMTPGHFLVGSAPLSFPEPSQKVDLTITPSNRWRLIAQMRASFWNRWKKEVLHHLQQRNQWATPCPNLKEGDVVFMKDELTPPAHWPLARVIKLHPGADELVRVVTIKTADSKFVRPITKLVRLPVDDLVEQRALASPANQNIHP